MLFGLGHNKGKTDTTPGGGSLPGVLCPMTQTGSDWPVLRQKRRRECLPFFVWFCCFFSA